MTEGPVRSPQVRVDYLGWRGPSRLLWGRYAVSQFRFSVMIRPWHLSSSMSVCLIRFLHGNVNRAIPRWYG